MEFDPEVLQLLCIGTVVTGTYNLLSDGTWCYSQVMHAPAECLCNTSSNRGRHRACLQYGSKQDVHFRMHLVDIESCCRLLMGIISAALQMCLHDTSQSVDCILAAAVYLVAASCVDRRPWRSLCWAPAHVLRISSGRCIIFDSCCCQPIFCT